MSASWRSFRNSSVLVIVLVLVAGRAAFAAAPSGAVEPVPATGFPAQVGEHRSVASQEATAGQASTTSSSGASSQTVMDSATLAPASSGLTIRATFDASITGNVNSATIEAMINRALSVYPSLFSDPITVSILFRYAKTAPDGTSLAPSTLAQSYYGGNIVPWNTFLADLEADAKTSRDAEAIASITTQVGSNVRASTANQRAIGIDQPGLLSADGSCCTGTFDGIITLNSAQPFQFARTGGTGAGSYDAQRTTEHEIDEVLGLGSIVNTPGANGDVRPQDIFSWSAAGTRNITAAGARYFSTDSGTTNIVSFNQNGNGDFGDWLSTTCPQGTPYVQNAFSCMGQSSDVTHGSPEGINLDVIGYDDTVGVAVPALSPAGLGCLAGLLLLVAGANASTSMALKAPRRHARSARGARPRSGIVPSLTKALHPIAFLR